jgi:heterotetrameric sarcosine oxidase gamma subunit
LLRLHSLIDPAALDKALTDCGISLPAAVGSAFGKDPAALCLRPGEWLLVSEQQEPEAWMRLIRPSSEQGPTALLNMSDGLGMFRLSGPAAPWLLAKYCGLDMAAVVAGGQQVARTRIADIAVVVHSYAETEGGQRFDLFFDRSVAPYLWSLLREAMPHADELYEHHGAVA